MRKYLELGTTPSGEDCAQVGSENYNIQTRIECLAYIDQLKRTFPNATENNTFGIKQFPHDFGSYHEVVVYYRESDEESIDYAFEVENNVPEYWDDEARQKMAELQNQTA